MKKVFKTIFLFSLAFILNANVGYADTEITKRAKIVFEHVEAGQTLTLVSDLGQVLFKEKISESGKYVKFLDLSPLPNGSYRIELDKTTELTIIPVIVDNNTTEINYDAAYVYNKPVINVINNTVYVSKISSQQEPVTVKFYYDSAYSQSGEKLIFNESIGEEYKIERAYKLSENEKGNYRVVVSSGDRTFSENIKI